MLSIGIHITFKNIINLFAEELGDLIFITQHKMLLKLEQVSKKHLKLLSLIKQRNQNNQGTTINNFLPSLKPFKPKLQVECLRPFKNQQKDFVLQISIFFSFSCGYINSKCIYFFSEIFFIEFEIFSFQRLLRNFRCDMCTYRTLIELFFWQSQMDNIRFQESCVFEWMVSKRKRLLKISINCRLRQMDISIE
ncbi:unnamed protein product [Paramecium sonneborni]|uniref:Uncharacterized protein n=1 Tax=Paramecium sonneborni TaxID=65129 RepID=A0A8S1M3F3_9CILI|nr:unnamed protein product [Paramecium sonneborni]